MGLIHLDSNYLAKLHSPTDDTNIESRQVREWMLNENKIATCAISWTEFLRGPKDMPLNRIQIGLTRAMSNGGISPFGEFESEHAANLFNLIGRPKRTNDKHRMDCLIASCAILAEAEFATMNTEDFKVFQDHRLRLASATVFH